MNRTPKRTKPLTNNDDLVNVTPPNRVLKPKVLNTLDKGPVNGSPGTATGLENSGLSPGETRRGRPRAETLNNLILVGSTSPSPIKCSYCSRVFPRDKSLQAHLRTHTGEKPYICDFPRCTKKFAQSGQLKTHQRLHTGEKPFICSFPNCESRFTHANRHCPEHPGSQLKRYTTPGSSNNNNNCSSIDKKFDEGHNAEVRQWLMKIEKRNKRSNSSDSMETTPKKSRFKREDSNYNTPPPTTTTTFYSCSQNLLLNNGIENSPKSELDDTSSYSNSDGFDNISINSPRASVELPKKRWLREAQQELVDTTNDLAQPINWGEDLTSNSSEDIKIEPVNLADNSFVIKPERNRIIDDDIDDIDDDDEDDDDDNEQNGVNIDDNYKQFIIDSKTPIEYIEHKITVIDDDDQQKRPTVLVRVQGGNSKQITSDDMQGAMALVELKNAYKYRV